MVWSRGGAAASVLRLVAALAVASAALAQAPVRLGAELQVNSYTSDGQILAAVASDDDGDFVITWSSFDQDGALYGIFGQRFDSAGQRRGTEFQVNSHTGHFQSKSAVATESNGDFVVVWQSFLQDGSDYGVFARRFDSAGAPKGVELQVNTYTPNTESLPSVASDTDGDFVVVWQREGPIGAALIFAQRFDSSGAAQGIEFQVNSSTIVDQRYPRVASENDGDFTVVWSGGGNVEIFGRHFSSAGAPVGAEFRANTYTTGIQQRPAIGVGDDGRFLVTWESESQDGEGGGIFAQRFDSTGAPQGTDFQVNTYTLDLQRRMAVAVSSGGDFVVTWESLVQDGSEFGVFARRFNAAGVGLAVELQVSTFTDMSQSLATVAAESNGDFVIAWASDQDGSSTGVFAQRFAGAPLAILDVDGNDSLGALTDGLLILRHFFGFSGTTLTNAAVGANCSRCDSAAIAPYISGLGNVLDIDDSGNLGALTDGLLIVRFLFGFTGTTLTNGAVGACGTRCDAATILPYLQTLD